MNENIQLVQKCYEEFGKKNIEGILNMLADDVVWINPGYPELPFSGRCVGKNDVLNFFVNLDQASTLTRFEPQEFYSDGDYVFVKGYLEGHTNIVQKTFESDWMMMWQVKNGKVKTYQAFNETYKMAKAFEEEAAEVEKTAAEKQSAAMN